MRPGLVLLYAKAPRIGLAKTRLAAGLGRAEARRIAAFTLARTLKAVRTSALPARIYTSPDRMAVSRAGQAAFGAAALWRQGAGGLSERLSRGLAEAPAGPVVFIGADAPDLTAAHLRAAVRALRRRDAVFGPAADGGFWLFGMRKRPGTRAPFAGVRWSGPHAMADVTARLPPGAKVAWLETLADIDEAADWQRWRGAQRETHRKLLKCS